MIDTIVKNKEFIGILISFLSIGIPLSTFLINKNKEQKQINFERFHNNLMKGLSNQEDNLGLDQQVAIIYEFRNYPNYYPVIERILKYQINRWKDEIKNKPHFQMLITESEATLDYINSSPFKRVWSNKKYRNAKT